MTRTTIVVLLLALAAAAQQEPGVDSVERDRADVLRAQHAYDAGRYDEAIRTLREVHGRGAGSGATWALLGHSLFERAQNGPARAAFVEALARGRFTSDVLLRIAEIDRARGDLLGAVQGLQLAGILLPEDRKLPVATADLAAEAGLPSLAEQKYVEAREKNPGSADPLVRLGNLYLKTGRNDAALEAFRTADAFGAANLTRLIAELHLARGDPERAASTYERLVAEDPAAPEPRLRCAELYLAAGAPAEAERHAAYVADHAEDPHAAHAHLLLGRIRMRAGDTEAAMRHWRTALSAGAGTPELHGLVGMHLHRTGDHAQAARHLRLCLKGSGPDRVRQAALVESLIAAGEPAVAREEVVRLVEEFGMDERSERLIARLAGADRGHKP